MAICPARSQTTAEGHRPLSLSPEATLVCLRFAFWFCCIHGSPMTAGILCAVVSHPADVMVSKLNANRQPGEAFGAAMGRIYKDIGFGGLWNGLVIRIFMIGTLTSLRKSVLLVLVSRSANKVIRMGYLR